MATETQKRYCPHCKQFFPLTMTLERRDRRGFVSHHCPFCLKDLDQLYCCCGQLLSSDPDEEEVRGEGVLEVRICSFCHKRHFVFEPNYHFSVPSAPPQDPEALFCPNCQCRIRPISFRFFDRPKKRYHTLKFCPACGYWLESPER